MFISPIVIYYGALVIIIVIFREKSQLFSVVSCLEEARPRHLILTRTHVGVVCAGWVDVGLGEGMGVDVDVDALRRTTREQLLRISSPSSTQRPTYVLPHAVPSLTPMPHSTDTPAPIPPLYVLTHAGGGDDIRHGLRL